MPSAFRSQFNPYSVEWSPFLESRLALATSQHFGIVGIGRMHILDLLPTGEILQLRSYDTQDGLYDCSWSEQNENHLVAACGNGSIKLWDLGSPEPFPWQSYQEHAKEVHSVDWNMVAKDSFVSGSWDCSVKHWDPMRPHSLSTWAEHGFCVYATVFSPHFPHQFASASGDCTLKIWDIRAPVSTQTIHAHTNEILSCDWNKYNPFVIATGSVDKSIKLWDIRSTSRELSTLLGHAFTIRRLKFSPHSENILASCSYDMSLALWDTTTANIVDRFTHHTEFVTGVDFNLFSEGCVASCSWDETLTVWRLGAEKPPPTTQLQLPLPLQP